MFRHSHLSRLLTPLCFVVLSLGLIVGPLLSRAQPPAAEPPKDLREAQELVQAVEDIGEMKTLNPLKLTNVQLNKLIDMITAAQTEYTSNMATFDQSALKKVAEDIRSARKQAVSGKDVPAEVNDRINKTIDASLKSRQEIHNKALASLSQKVRGILLTEQISAAAKVAKEETEKATQRANGTEAQWFNAYVQSVIMKFPRIVPLLKDIRASREGGEK